MNGLKKFVPSELQPKPIVSRLQTFSRALRCLRVFSSGFDWSSGLSLSFVIGQSGKLGFGYTTLN